MIFLNASGISSLKHGDITNDFSGRFGLQHIETTSSVCRLRGRNGDRFRDLANMTLDMNRIEETRDLLGAEVFAKFLKRLEEEMDVFIDWQSAAPAPTADEIALRCHTLASSAGLYGARDLRSALLAAERVANSGDAVELSKMTCGLAGIWDDTKLGFRELT